MPIKNLKCNNCSLDFEKLVFTIDKTIAYKCKYCDKQEAYVTNKPLPLADTKTDIHNKSKMIDKGMNDGEWLKKYNKLPQQQ